MSVRFVIGRAGSGKTHFCIEAVRAELRRDPVDGPRLILLVPEQAAMQTERAIIEPDDIGAAHRAEVLSFQRLAFRVMDHACAPVRTVVSESARAMVLRHLLAQRRSRLRYYHRVDRLTGLSTQLGTTIAELIQEAVSPDALDVLAGADADGDPAQRAKLHDIRELYAAYLDYLGPDRVDSSQRLQVARDLMPRCPWLGDALVWVDGFASLMRQESLTLLALATLCRRMEVTVLMDSALAEPAAARSAWDHAALFRKTARTFGDLSRAFAESGVSIEPPLFLPAEPPPRFAGSTALAALERGLFRTVVGHGGSTRAHPAEHGARPPTAPASKSPRIEVVQLPSRRIEVDFALSRVIGWVQDSASAYRYRDVAIITRDLEPYHDLLVAGLTARGIPFFMDRRRDIGHHPLPALLRALLAIAAESLSLESIRALLKTDLLPVSQQAADELENYLLAHGLSGPQAWEGDDWAFVTKASLVDRDDRPEPHEEQRRARVNQTRRALLDALQPWLVFATDAAGHTGEEWSCGILAALERLAAGDAIERWAVEAEQRGELDEAAEHRQVWRDTHEFMEDMALAFRDPSPLDVETIAQVVDAGLTNLTLGLAPPMVDQVLVGSIERSRQPNIKAAVLLGFNEGAFPRQHAEDPVLNDDDRGTLRKHGLDVLPPSGERLLDEPLLLYIAVTRPSERLVVTYAATDPDGKALRPSAYLAALTSACSDLAVRHLADPSRSRESWDVLSPTDLTRRLGAEFRQRPPRLRDEAVVRARWNEVYESTRRETKRDPAGRRMIAALADPSPAALSPAAVERLHRGPLNASVSQLESYAACPFQHFGRYVLRLSERPEAPLAPVDVGQLHHAVLEDFAATLVEHGTGFGQLSDQDLVAGLRESCGRVGARVPAHRVASRPRDAYLVRRTSAHLARILRAQQTVAKVGQAAPRATELAFGFSGLGGLPALELTTPKGRTVRLRGFIDRVDLAEWADETLGIVIDYKRTKNKRLDLSSAYHGLSLQLLAYLLVLAEHGTSLAGRPIQPIAALYVGLVPSRKVVDHPSDLSSRSATFPGELRPRGLIRAEAFEALAGVSQGSGWSEHYAMFRKKDGQIGNINRGDAAPEPAFRATLAHTRAKLGELADRLLNGDVAVRPYRLGTFSPCSWCSIRSVCRFELGICDVRFLPRWKRSEIFVKLESASP